MGFGTGTWKEGRQGGASLCYLAPAPSALEWVAPNHAAVGIRATVACAGVSPVLATLVQRNWDLAILAGAQVASALAALDGRTERGVVADPATRGTAAAGLYRVARAVGVIGPPGDPAPDPLPGQPLPTDVDAAERAIDAVVTAGQWGIWLVDDAALAALGPSGHAALLGWLGTHHARVWCAPIRDIAAWRTQASQQRGSQP